MTDLDPLEPNIGSFLLKTHVTKLSYPASLVDLQRTRLVLGSRARDIHIIELERNELTTVLQW